MILDLDKQIPWPDLAICKNPKFKNSTLWNELNHNYENGNIKNLNEFNEMVEKAYYTDPKDFISDISISMNANYLASMSVPGLDLRGPEIRVDFTDYQYFGFCTIISFETIRKKHQKAMKYWPREHNNFDSDFIANVWLKVLNSVRHSLGEQLLMENSTKI